MKAKLVGSMKITYCLNRRNDCMPIVRPRSNENTQNYKTRRQHNRILNRQVTIVWCLRMFTSPTSIWWKKSVHSMVISRNGVIFAIASLPLCTQKRSCEICRNWMCCRWRWANERRKYSANGYWRTTIMSWHGADCALFTTINIKSLVRTFNRCIQCLIWSQLRSTASSAWSIQLRTLGNNWQRWACRLIHGTWWSFT